MRNMKLKAALLLLVAAGILSCKKDNDKDLRPGKVTGVDLSKCDYIGYEINDNSVFDLFAVTVEGDSLISKPLEFTDEAYENIKQEFVSYKIEEIARVNENYFAIHGHIDVETDAGTESFRNILINQTTGSLYDLKDYRATYSYSKNQTNEFQEQDSDGNVYFKSGSIMKLSGLNAGDPQIEEYVSQSQTSDEFIITPEGHCFTSGGIVKFATGGIASSHLGRDIFKGADGQAYSIHIFDGLKKATVTENGVAVDTILPGKYFSDVGLSETPFTSYIVGDECTFLINDHGYDGLEIFMYFHKTEIFTKLLLPESVSFNKCLAIINNDFYLESGSGEDQAIYICDITKYTEESEGQYQMTYDTKIATPISNGITKYNVLSDGTISFSGYDRTNEKDVTGVMDEDGNVISYTESEKMTLIPLEKIK